MLYPYACESVDDGNSDYYDFATTGETETTGTNFFIMFLALLISNATLLFNRSASSKIYKKKVQLFIRFDIISAARSRTALTL